MRNTRIESLIGLLAVLAFSASFSPSAFADANSQVSNLTFSQAEFQTSATDMAYASDNGSSHGRAMLNGKIEVKKMMPHGIPKSWRKQCRWSDFAWSDWRTTNGIVWAPPGHYGWTHACFHNGKWYQIGGGPGQWNCGNVVVPIGELPRRAVKVFWSRIMVVNHFVYVVTVTVTANASVNGSGMAACAGPGGYAYSSVYGSGSASASATVTARGSSWSEAFAKAKSSATKSVSKQKESLQASAQADATSSLSLRAIAVCISPPPLVTPNEHSCIVAVSPLHKDERTYDFTATADGPVTLISWSFSDGNSATGNPVEWTFPASAAGTTTVSATATVSFSDGAPDATCTGTGTIPAYTGDPPPPPPPGA